MKTALLLSRGMIRKGERRLKLRCRTIPPLK
jgi:hypothetical protein